MAMVLIVFIVSNILSQLPIVGAQFTIDGTPYTIPPAGAVQLDLVEGTHAYEALTPAGFDFVASNFQIFPGTYNTSMPQSGSFDIGTGATGGVDFEFTPSPVIPPPTTNPLLIIALLGIVGMALVTRNRAR